MSLRLYTGEYLIGPTLLHFGGNWCSHNCAYCFANLNKPDRATDINDLALVYKWHDTGSTRIEYELMRAGHPVMMSNDSDPCSKTNWAVFSAVHDASLALGFQMTFQTRGGMEQAEKRIVNSRPTMVYVSLTTDQEATRKRLEPGAPPHEQRMAFIAALKAAGHHVVIGLNPFVPDWWDNLNATFERLSDMGVAHVWHQAMHMSRHQVAAFPEKKRAEHAELINYAMKKVAPDAGLYRQGLRGIAAMGFNLFSGGVSDDLGFWDAYFDLGFPFSPTLDALVRDCDEQSGGKPVGLDIAEFNAWSDIGLVGERSIWKEFLNPFGRSMRNLGEDTKARTQAQANAAMWRIEDFRTPLSHPCFARIGYEGGYASDMEGVALMAVSREGFRDGEIQASDVTFLNHPIKRGHHG